MKKDHEKRFANPEKKILEKLVDWTRVEPTKVTNLKKLYAAIGLDLKEEQISESVTELNEYIDVLRRIPIEARRRAYAIVQRAQHMMGSRIVEDDPFDGTRILLLDFANSHRISPWNARKIVRELEGYGLAQFDEIEIADESQEAILVGGPTMEWFGNIDSFCFLTGTDVDIFIEELDFSPFDVPLPA